MCVPQALEQRVRELGADVAAAQQSARAAQEAAATVAREREVVERELREQLEAVRRECEAQLVVGGGWRREA